MTDDELHQLALDVADAAGALPVPIPTPGTMEAKMLIANILMRRENEKLRSDLREAQGVACELRKAVMRGTHYLRMRAEFPGLFERLTPIVEEYERPSKDHL